MGIFKVEKKNLQGELVESFVFPNTVLDAGLEFLCDAVGNDFNKGPSIKVGTSDVTPDTNQNGLLNSISKKSATFTAGTSTIDNPSGNKTFIVSSHFDTNEAIGDLTEISYIMYTDIHSNEFPLNRTLFQVPGQLNTNFAGTPELDQIQNLDITNEFLVYGVNEFSQTFTPSSSATNVSEIALNVASKGSPSGPLSVKLYTDSAGSPGSLIGTTSIPAFGEPVARWRIAAFSSPVAVTGGSLYHIVVSASSSDAASAYVLFGSTSDVYAGGSLLKSLDSGSTFVAVSPSEDLGFKTYSSQTGATNHDYVLTLKQFGKETAASANFIANVFPESNIDSNSTTQGTVRLSLPTYSELPPFTERLYLYKKVGGTYNLLLTLGLNRQYTYDNGSITPNSSVHPPSASGIAAPTGLTATTDSTMGGPLNLSQDKYYKVSAIQQGSPIKTTLAGPFQENDGGSGAFYTSAYTTISLPMSAAYYETAASTELHLTAPSTSTGPFAEYFDGTALDTTKWNFTNNNTDYFNFVTPSDTGENQLQLDIPGGVPFVISSTRQVRSGQTYYVNVAIPWLSQPKPLNLVDGGGNPYVNPIYTDNAPNRVPVLSFVNPNNINSFNADKRLTLEVGFYNNYLTETQGSPTTGSYSRGPQWCLYDNIGNAYFFSTTDIAPSHSDGAYTFKIDILADRTMQISVLDSVSHTFHVISSSLFTFNFHNQTNKTHTTGGGGLPGPLTQTTNHFIVPESYSFAIGNPSNDPLSFVPANTAYISVADSIYTISGISPAVPVPAITLRSSGYQGIVSWNPVPGARKYRVYTSTTSGDYTAVNGTKVAEYETYFPAYAVQSTTTAEGNDWFNSIAGAGTTSRNWLDVGVTYGVDTLSTGDTNSYAVGGFIGSVSGYFGGPTVPTIAGAPGSAEGYLLLLNAAGQHALFTFCGGGFDIFGETGPDRGIASIYIDGNFVADVDFYSSDRQQQVKVFTTNSLSLGYHTVKVYPKSLSGVLQSNDFSLGTAVPLDYFVINTPAVVDLGTVVAGAPLASPDSHIAAIPAPNIKGSKTYNGNGPTVVNKDPQHTLDVSLTFSLVNPNL